MGRFMSEAVVHDHVTEGYILRTGISFEHRHGQHILKNPQIITSIVEKVRFPCGGGEGSCNIGCPFRRH